MSLIHKALKKAEKKDRIDIDNINEPVEEILLSGKKRKFMSSEITPRTILLLVVAILAGIYAVYVNYFMDDVKKEKNAPQQVTAAAKEEVYGGPAEGAAPAQSSGLSVSEPAGTSNNISDEALNLKSEGEKYFLEGDTKQALMKFEDALTHSPDSSEILNSMGLVYKKEGNVKEAEKYYTWAIDKNPECAECLNNLAVLKADADDKVSAVLYLKRAIDASETYADPYFNLAIIMEKEGNIKSAVDSYKKFLSYTSTGDEQLKNKVRERIEFLALDGKEK